MTNETVIGHGSPAPDLPGAFVSEPSFDVAANGTVGVRASLVVGSGGVTVDDNEGVWTCRPDSSRLVARKGDTAPSGTRTFEGFGDVATNGLEDVAFVGVLDRSTTMRRSRSGIWSTLDGTLRRVAQEGFPAPGVPGFDFDSFAAEAPEILMGGAGDLLFSGVLRGADESENSGLWLVEGESIELLVREGDAAPGMEGVVFGDFGATVGDSNDDSDFVFQTRIRAAPGEEPLPADAAALYACNTATGELRLLVSNNDWSIDVSEAGDGSDVRTVDSDSLNSWFSFNQWHGLADNGWVVFAAQFSDESGAIFRQNLREFDELCAGDFNGDGMVDILDFGVFGAAFETAQGDPGFDVRADFTGDGVVDIQDFGVFGAEFGRDDCRVVVR
jgi:hypothetical protein